MPRFGGTRAAVAMSRGLAAPAGDGAVARGGSAADVWDGTPWRGLILPPPGGAPYFATISGGAMIEPLPRTSVPSVVGILSSSTQTYSGSLGTSPKRGFLIRSQRVSADLIVTDGSPGDGTPRAERTPEQPDSSTTRASHHASRCFIVSKIAQARGQSSTPGSHGNRCSSAAVGGTSGWRRENSAVPVTAEIHVVSRYVTPRRSMSTGTTQPATSSVFEIR